MTDLLEIKKLSIDYFGRHGAFRALDGLDLDIRAAEIVGVVGESGSGKSSVAMAIGRLLDPRRSRMTGSILFEGRDILSLGKHDLREVRKTKIAYVFQEPAVSLNPVLRIHDQVEEVWPRPDGARVLELLEQVRLADAARVARSYPHELSGGMKQRVMIAMALAKKPRLLIADEPTTALDVTVQRDILRLLVDLKKRSGMSLLLITHDLHVARAVSDRIFMIRAGRLVETVRGGESFQVRSEYGLKLVESSMFVKPPKTRLDVE